MAGRIPAAQEVVTLRERRGLGAAADPKLRQDTRHVDADRLLTDVQLSSDLTVRPPFDEQGQDLSLSRCERLRPTGLPDHRSFGGQGPDLRQQWFRTQPPGRLAGRRHYVSSLGDPSG